MRLAVERRWVLAVAGLVACASSLSCGGTKPKPPPPPRYETLPPKQIPDFLRGTMIERMDHLNAEPLTVSNYGLVVNLPGTGDGTAPTVIREYLIKEMVKRGFGSVQRPGFENLSPERVLDDPRKQVAIVRVDGFMPPGVRKGQTFDVVVSALPDSGVTSLAGGTLYRTDLKFGGADTRNPAGVIEVQGHAEGPVFVNPSMTLNPRSAASDRNASRTSRRQGLILDGGICNRDQPLIVRMRAPQRSVVRQIEQRIKQHFQDPNVASAKDEAVIHLFVPPSFKGDWERFMGVCNHLYLDATPEVLALRARKLGEEALKPDAPLENISYAWEGMGVVALPAITPLMDEKYPQEVQFAAARAAAFIGDGVAPQALVRIASSPNNRFQVDAVRVLGALRQTPNITALLRRLLDSPSAVVRVEAYKVLAAAGSNAVFSMYLPQAGKDERFVLDVVPGTQPPIVYATRSGIPRIAIIGQSARLALPITFTALDDRLSISSIEGQSGVSVFYRQEGAPQPVRISARPDLAELVGWLGGAAREPDKRINLTYGEIVAVVQALADQKRLVSSEALAMEASFVLQEVSAVSDEISTAPPIIPRARPQSEAVPGLPTTRQVGPEPGEKPAKKPATPAKTAKAGS